MCVCVCVCVHSSLILYSEAVYCAHNKAEDKFLWIWQLNDSSTVRLEENCLVKVSLKWLLMPDYWQLQQKLLFPTKKPTKKTMHHGIDKSDRDISTLYTLTCRCLAYKHESVSACTLIMCTHTHTHPHTHTNTHTHTHKHKHTHLVTQDMFISVKKYIYNNKGGINKDTITKPLVITSSAGTRAICTQMCVCPSLCYFYFFQLV